MFDAALASLGEPVDGRLPQLVSQIRHHLEYCQAAGIRPTLTDAFTTDRINTSLELAAAAGYATGPISSHLKDVAAAVRHRKKLRHFGRISTPSRLAPYSADQQTAFYVAAAAGMRRDYWSFRSALALGIGGRVIGDYAGTVFAHHLHDLDEHLIAVEVPGAPYRWAIVAGIWATRLRDCAAHIDEGSPLTDAYTVAGRQRIDRILKNARWPVKFRGSRLKTTWIIDRLNYGTPADALALLLGVRPVTLTQYLPFTQPVPLAITSQWASRTEPAAPPFPEELMKLKSGDDASRSTNSLGHRVSMPIDPAAAEVWTAGLARHAETLVQAQTAVRRRNLLQALRTELTWAVHWPGAPTTLDGLLTDTIITNWSDNALGRAGELRRAKLISKDQYDARLRSLAATRGRLRSLALLKEGTARTPKGTAHRYANAYAAEDIDELDALLEADPPLLSAAARSTLHSLKTVILATGARRREATRAQPVDVTEKHGHIVLALGPLRREVPASVRYATELQGLADDSKSRYLTGLSTIRIQGHLERIDAILEKYFDPERLRRRWMLDHLERNIPFPVLSAMAGTTAPELNELVAQMRPRRSAELLAWAATYEVIPRSHPG